MKRHFIKLYLQFGILIALAIPATGKVSGGEFKGKYCEGKGDVEYLCLIDRSFEFFHANSDVQNLSMLYYPLWNCLIEASYWQGWWAQNSFGPTYCALPFLEEPYLTFLQNSQDLWWKWQGDGKKKDLHGLVGPPGCLCDAATPKWGCYAQGDLVMMYPGTADWTYGATLASVIMQAELLLISRDVEAIKKYLPGIELACEFLEKPRDPNNNLFLVGPGADLLAPAYGGVRKADGSVEKAYLAEHSIHYISLLERVIELEKMAGKKDEVSIYEARLEKTRKSLAQLLSQEGYFVKFIERDGMRHGLLNQDKFNYFNVTPNVDAIAFGSVDKTQAEKIFRQIDALPGLRPNVFMLPNWPGLDDMYEFWGTRDINAPPFSKIWEVDKAAQRACMMNYGVWVNGGVWTTLEARVILSYYRLGRFEDVRRSANRMMEFADDFILDAPLVDFGKEPWNKSTPSFCYDFLGVPAATIRGLFEYIYEADSITLYPHIPASIKEYYQKEPIRFGGKRIRICVKNKGIKIKSVKVNGRRVKTKTAEYVTLMYDALPNEAKVEIVMAGRRPKAVIPIPREICKAKDNQKNKLAELSENYRYRYEWLKSMQKKLKEVKDAEFEKAFVAEAILAYDAYRERTEADSSGKYNHLKAEKRIAILKSYEDGACGMFYGFDMLMKKYTSGQDASRQNIAALWGGGKE